MLPPQLLKDAETFVKILRKDAELIHLPELKFLKDYMESLGAQIPLPKKQPASSSREESTMEEEEPEEPEEPESEESELEFDSSNVIPEESDEPQPMGDDSIEVTEELSDEADNKRCEAQAKFSDGNFEEAVTLFTESIMANPTRAVCFAKRAACFVKLQKPASAIRDCNKAISLNPDSAAAYRWRGLAHKLLGQWEAAYLDLQTSLKLDFDDNVNDAVKELEPMHKRIHDHNLMWERKREERKYNELKKAHAARQKARREEDAANCGGCMPGGMPCGGMPAGMHGGGMPGGMPGGGMPEGMGGLLNDLLSDPEMMSAMQDPELQKAFSSGAGPAGFAAAMKNPKLAKVFEKLGKMQEPAEAANKPTSTPGGDDLD